MWQKIWWWTLMWWMEGRDHYISIINAAGFQPEVCPKYKLSAQRVPKLDLLPGIFYVTQPSPIQYWKHQAAGNPKYLVLPDILGKPEVSGIPRNYWVLGSPQYMLEKNFLFGSLSPKNRWYIQYTLKYPAIPRNTWKYPWVKKTPENNRSYISKLLPDPNRTCFPVACIFPNTQPDLTFKDLLGTLYTIEAYSNILISATPLEYFATQILNKFLQWVID